MASLTHEERTFAEFRQSGLHKVVLDKIDQVNHNVRLLRLKPKSPEEKKSIKATKPEYSFLPGQWLDVHVPGIAQAGGFTITSAPEHLEKDDGYLELAIQESPRNPPAAWLWQASSKILGSDLAIRAGGSFVWPPPGIDPASVDKVVFIAGGVGINPLISILSHLSNNVNNCPPYLQFLYSAKKGPAWKASSILFVERLASIFEPNFTNQGVQDDNVHRAFKLFVTNTSFPKDMSDMTRLHAISAMEWNKNYIPDFDVEFRRFKERDLELALGPVDERKGTVAYVCGPPAMTDWAVGVLRGAEGMAEKRVLCEKWW